MTPGDDERRPITDRPEDEGRRRFYQGVLVRLRPGSRTGVLRTASGRDVEFAARDTRFLGTEGFTALREGMQVGFDLGWTSHGVRVTLIKVF